MFVIIQIPCYNEEAFLPDTLRELPRELPGIDSVEWLVVDDGSTDRTAEVAREYGADHVVQHPQNLGLARAFTTGLSACIARGADIIVNTDADNQYYAADIAKLIEPIRRGRADLVVGARPIHDIAHFSQIKKFLERLGSWTVRKASLTQVADAPSGFRAISREAAMQLNVFSDYTYTLETIIQAGRKGLTVVSVPVRVNDITRPSRLIKSLPGYIGRSAATIPRILMIYRPLYTFLFLGSVPFLVGFFIGLRFVVYYAIGQGGGKIQSLILAALLMGLGFILLVFALLADLIGVNRQLLEKLDMRIQQVEETFGTARRD
jgi:glycosyltransferase involved in cell wall biosynthesis